MKHPRTLRLTTLAGICLAIGTTVQAQDAPNYYYLGLGVGQSHSQIDELRTINSAFGALATGATVQNTQRQDTSYKLFGGYQFNRGVGLELGYFNLGKFNFNAANTTGTLAGQYEVDGTYLDLVGTVPLGERFSAFGRIGAQYANTKNNFSGTGTLAPAPGNSNKWDTQPKIGFGLQYDISPSMQVRGEGDIYRINDGFGNLNNVSVWSMSLVFPMGRASRPRPTPVAYVAPAPAPMPAPVPVYVAPPMVVAAPAPTPMPVARVKSRVQLSADSLFSFDKAGLSADGKSALDSFARDSKGTTFDTVSVEGNADRLGSAAYNQKLSEERADTVKTYLATTSEMRGVTINASGRGETNPETKPGDCIGNKATKALVACLQPDRRVDVEMVGVR